MWLKAVWILVFAITFDTVTSALDEYNSNEEYDDEEIPAVYNYNIDKSVGRQWIWPEYAVYWVRSTDIKLMRLLQKQFKLKNLVTDWDDYENLEVYRVKVSPEQRANFVKLLHCRKIEYNFNRKEIT